MSANFLFLLAARGEDLRGRAKAEDAFEGRVGIPAVGLNELGTALHFLGPISEPRQGVWDMAGLNRIFQTVSEMSEIAIQGSKKSCSRLMSRLPLAFDASRCIHACSGNLKRYNVDDVRSRRLQVRPPPETFV